jgi:hypothetical protein
MLSFGEILTIGFSGSLTILVFTPTVGLILFNGLFGLFSLLTLGIFDFHSKTSLLTGFNSVDSIVILLTSRDGKSAIVDLDNCPIEEFELFFNLRFLRLYLAKPMNASAMIVIIIIMSPITKTINGITVKSVPELISDAVFCDPLILIEETVVSETNGLIHKMRIRLNSKLSFNH